MTTTQNDAPTGAGLQAPKIHDVPIGLATTGTRRDPTLREAALASGYISAADFDGSVNPSAMVGQ